MTASIFGSNLEIRDYAGPPSHTWVKEFVDEIKARQCERPLASGLSFDTHEDLEWTYCGDYLENTGLVYIAGPHSMLPRIITDCDGYRGDAKGECDREAPIDGWKNETAFRPLVQSLGHGLVDLNPYVHPYVALGSVGGKSHTTDYDPKTHKILPLSLVAVFCGNTEVRYGIWGDYARPSRPWVGQVSPAMKSLCPEPKTTAEERVAIVAFNGREAVPGPWDANWDARSPQEFSDSMHILGDKLMKRIYRRGRYSSASPSQVRHKGRVFATLMMALTMAHALSILSLF